MDEDLETSEFTNKDAEELTSYSAGRKLVEELKLKLTQSRMQVDTINSDRLPVLQGRIATLKELIDLLGVEYE